MNGHNTIVTPAIAGVDTHKDTHYAAVITTTGQHLAAAQFAANDEGYRTLAAFISNFGDVVQVGVEGTNSYGAGLARHLAAVGMNVVEILRPSRQTRRAGKSDEIDAYLAAHTALSEVGCSTPKTSDGPVEAIRVVTLTRHSGQGPHRGHRPNQSGARLRARAAARPISRLDNPAAPTDAATGPRMPGRRHRHHVDQDRAARPR